MNFLIAEDSAKMRRMLRQIVAESDDRVYECADGAAAVAAYAERQPDWVLMDIKMPKLDGLTATRRIRAMDCAARIIIVTGFDDPALRVAAAEAGAAAFVVKDDLSGLRALLLPG